nr:MAG TPA: hypothetical protein [Caudoviricetes sp.]
MLVMSPTRIAGTSSEAVRHASETSKGEIPHVSENQK